MAFKSTKGTMWDIFKNGPNVQTQPLSPTTTREKIELEKQKEKIHQDTLIDDIGEFNKIRFDI